MGDDEDRGVLGEIDDLLELSTDEEDKAILEELRSGWNDLMVDTEWQKIESALTSDVTKKTLDVLNTLKTSWNKLSDGDPKVAMSGVLDIAAILAPWLAATAPVTGPIGPALALLLPSLCKLTSAALMRSSEQGQQERLSQEEMIRDMVEILLVDMESLRLESLAAGQLALMELHLRVLTELSKTTDDQLKQESKLLSNAMSESRKTTSVLQRANSDSNWTKALGLSESTTRQLQKTQNERNKNTMAVTMVSGSEFLSSGVDILGRLWFYIKRDKESDDVARVERAMKLLTSFAALSYLRVRILTMLGCLYGRMKENFLAETTLRLLFEQKSKDSERLRFLTEAPLVGSKNNAFFQSLHMSLELGERRIVEEYCWFTTGSHFPGTLVKILDIDGDRFLRCNNKGKFCAAAAPTAHGQTQESEDVLSTWFRVIETTRNDGKKGFNLYSCSAARYLRWDNVVEAGEGKVDEFWQRSDHNHMLWRKFDPDSIGFVHVTKKKGNEVKSGEGESTLRVTFPKVDATVREAPWDLDQKLYSRPNPNFS